MSNFSKVILVGHLTKDPELRYTAAGNPISRLRLAVNRKWNSPEGEAKEEASFFNVTSFGRTAETVSKYLQKGHPLLVDGRLRSYRWEDDKGQPRHEVEVVMEHFQFLPRRDKGAPRTADDEASVEPIAPPFEPAPASMDA